MSKKYAKKIIFNISQFDLGRMNAACVKLDVDQSTYIRRALCMYTAEQIVQEYSDGKR